MYEIELKAHVEDYEKVKKTIDSFATFLGQKHKLDEYWSLRLPSSKQDVRVRIREETNTTIDNAKSQNILVTYKQKELRHTHHDGSNIGYEVNKEHEFSISDKKAFETILIDTGFKIDFEKEKTVLQWQYDEVLLELCTINALGDFLELEIISEKNDNTTVVLLIKKLQSVLLQCGIPLEKIEKRYYSELLKDHN